MKDYCSYFPEYWFETYIGGCCKVHDESCSSHKFYNCLRTKISFVGSMILTIGGGLGCWIKYTKKMLKRL